MADIWIVLGLGNPGLQYENNRHNVGHMVVSLLAERKGSNFGVHKSDALVAESFVRPGGPKLVLAKSRGFMNNSGGAAAGLLKYYSVEPDRLIVVHDELDLPFGRLRLKFGGGHGGHNGLRDISKAVGPDYVRVRVGIGRPTGRQDPADFVLADFSSTERVTLPNLVVDAVDAVVAVADGGLLAAQQQIHSLE